MYIFGGILEVTKELNDLMVYDFKTQRMTMHDQSIDASENLNFNQKLDDSTMKHSVNDGNNSPLGRNKTMVSPARRGMAGSSPNRRSTLGGSPNANSAMSKSPMKKT